VARTEAEVTSDLKSFLDLCEKSSARSRYVLIAMIFATVIMFGGTWKQAPISWFDSDFLLRVQADQVLRLRDALKEAEGRATACAGILKMTRVMLDDEAAQPPATREFRLVRNFSLDVALLKPCGDITGSLAKSTVETCVAASRPNTAAVGQAPTVQTAQSRDAPLPTDRERACVELRELDHLTSELLAAAQAEVKVYGAKLEGEALKNATIFLSRYLPVKTDKVTEDAVRERVRRELDETRRLRTDNEALFHLPIFGVVFHVNDLGILGGFTIFVLLLWMRAALDEEVNGLQITRKQILIGTNEVWPGRKGGTSADVDQSKERKAYLGRLYELLSMQQFFFRPQPFEHGTENFGSRALRYAVIGLVCLPVAIELALFLTDISSEAFIFLANKGGYLATLIVSGAFLALNSVLTYFAVRSAIDQVVVWREIASDFANDKPPGPESGQRT